MLAHEVLIAVLMVLLVVCLVAVAVLTVMMGIDCSQSGGSFRAISGACVHE